MSEASTQDHEEWVCEALGVPLQLESGRGLVATVRAALRRSGPPVTERRGPKKESCPRPKFAPNRGIAQQEGPKVFVIATVVASRDLPAVGIRTESQRSAVPEGFA